MAEIKIEARQHWREKHGSDIIEVKYISGSKITLRDINGGDYGAEADMQERFFRMKYQPTDKTLREYEKKYPGKD